MQTQITHLRLVAWPLYVHVCFDSKPYILSQVHAIIYSFKQKQVKGCLLINPWITFEQLIMYNCWLLIIIVIKAFQTTTIKWLVKRTFSGRVIIRNTNSVTVTKFSDQTGYKVDPLTNCLFSKSWDRMVMQCLFVNRKQVSNKNLSTGLNREILVNMTIIVKNSSPLKNKGVF